MYKRFRRATDQIIIAEDSSSDEEETAFNVSQIVARNRTANNKKYVRIQRNKTLDDSHISEASSNDDELEQENRRCLWNSQTCRKNAKAFQLTPSNNKFQPLSVAVQGKTISPTSSPTSALNSSTLVKNLSGTPSSTAWHGLRQTLGTLKRERSVLQTTVLDDSLIECSPSPSLEANLSTLVAKQSMSFSSSAPKKRRCIKGGYLQEFQRLVEKQRMDRRSLQHNQRLGIAAGKIVQVLQLHISFGVQMAQVVELEVHSGDVFNVILERQMAARIVVGAKLQIFFDPKEETALQLSNNQRVYIRPHKLVLL